MLSFLEELPPRKDGDFFDNAFTSISKGFSMFSTKATELARTAQAEAIKISRDVNDNYIKPTTEKLQDPSFRQNVSTTFNQLGASVTT